MKLTFTRLITMLLVVLSVGLDFSYGQSKSIWDSAPSNIKKKNAFKRTEWFVRQRAFPDDTLSHSVYFSELEKYKIIEEHAAFMRGTTENAWINIGPKGVVSGFPSHWGVSSGRVRAVAVHPTNPDIVYIGAANGGIWKTINGGEAWTDVSADFTSLSFGSIVIDPKNPNIVFAGTGEGMYQFNSVTYNGDGLYKSTNAGASWVKVSGGFGSRTHFNDIAISPFNSNVIIATLGSGFWHLGNIAEEGVYRSTDGGASFTRVMSFGDPFDVKFHPTDSNKVFVTLGGGTGNSGFYTSTNMGSTFSKVSTGAPTASMGRAHLAIAQSDPTIMYMLNYDGETKAYKSTNTGSTWVQISASQNLGGTYDGTNWNDQGWYDLCIAVSPADPNKLLTGNTEIFESTDGSILAPKRVGSKSGAWDSPMHVDYHKIVYAPSNPNIIYVGNDGGISRSTDGGATWQHRNNGINTLQLYDLSSHPTDEKKLIAGAQDNGNFHTSDKGATNYKFLGTGDGMINFYDYASPNRVYFSTQNGSLYRSENIGLSVARISPTESDNWAWTAPFWIHPKISSTIYGAGTKIHRSTDNGSTWSVISDTLSFGSPITTVSQSQVNPNKIVFAASEWVNTPVIGVSTDGGVTFTNVETKISGTQRYVTKVYCHPTDENTIYVVRTGFSTGNKIHKSTDFGVTWVNISGDLPNVPHNDIWIDPQNTKDIYVANDLGVYGSENNGTSWKRIGAGMPYLPIIALDAFISGGKRMLRAGSHGRGIYEIQLEGVLDIEPTRVNNFVLEQNYPNPFNPSTKITYALPEQGMVTLKVYNTLGEPVFIENQGTREAGKHDILFNASTLSSGVYFYTIEVQAMGGKSFSQTKKMMLLQ